MPSPQASAVSTRVFQIDRGECLYRDHLGRRVVADCEGSGSWFVSGREEGVVPVADGSPATGARGRFEESFTAFHTGDEAAVISVALGSPHDCEAADRHGQGTSEQGFAVALPQHCELVELQRFIVGDPLALESIGFKVQNMSDVTELDSAFADGTRRRSAVASHLNTASWSIEVPESAQAVVLRRTYDRFHGRQRARVSVDGTPAGYWYEPAQDRIRRWATTDFIVPGRLLDRGAHRLAIDPVAGSPLWSIAEMEVSAVVRR